LRYTLGKGERRSERKAIEKRERVRVKEREREREEKRPRWEIKVQSTLKRK
jgi:hypothetical protein